MQLVLTWQELFVVNHLCRCDAASSLATLRQRFPVAQQEEGGHLYPASCQDHPSSSGALLGHVAILAFLAVLLLLPLVWEAFSPCQCVCAEPLALLPAFLGIGEFPRWFLGLGAVPGGALSARQLFADAI